MSWVAGNRVKIAALGGIDDVLNSMGGHVKDVEVQRIACLALGKLAVNTENKVKITASGGVDDVLKAMREHAADGNVQHNARGTLRRFGRKVDDM